MWGKEDRSEKLGEERGRETETQFINEARSQRQHCGAELVVAEPRWSQPSSLGLWRRRTRFEHQKGAARPPPPTRNRRRRPLSPRRRAPPVRWPSPRTQARALRLYPTERCGFESQSTGCRCRMSLSAADSIPVYSRLVPCLKHSSFLASTSTSQGWWSWMFIKCEGKQR
ncbi:hypothetical protein MTO96_013290 [Rhipicephalus appendiculatus]